MVILSIDCDQKIYFLMSQPKKRLENVSELIISNIKYKIYSDYTCISGFWFPLYENFNPLADKLTWIESEEIVCWPYSSLNSSVNGGR